jgi:hypothetical protein
VVEGPDFCTGWRDPLPVGNVDIAPTLTQVLRLAPGTPFDGRVLSEALQHTSTDAPDWNTRDEQLTCDARGRTWVQRVWFECVGSANEYLTGGSIEAV